MVEDFKPLQQPLGSNSCLSTAITAILNHLGSSELQQDVSEWCEEDGLGSFMDLAFDRLREHGWSVEELTSNAESQMRSLVNDSDIPTPILAIVKGEVKSQMDHAVVVLGFQLDGDAGEIVHIMDPTLGAKVSMKAYDFLNYWVHAGQLAFVITRD